MRQIRLIVLCALAVSVPGRLAAQSIPSPYEYVETRHSVSVYGGYLQTDPGRLDLGPQPAPLFGARYGIHLTGPLLGEVDLGLVPTTRTIYRRTSNQPNPPLVGIGEAEVMTFLAEAGLVFQITGARTWRGLAPYLSLGGGLATGINQGDDDEGGLSEDQLYRFGPAFAAAAGVGTNFFVSERISIRLDFRDHFWRLNYPVGLTGTPERESQWRHNFGLTLGSAIHF